MEDDDDGASFPEFSRGVDRSGDHTVKHSFTPDGVLPMWVADMDLATAPVIHSAIVERARRPHFGYTVQPPELWDAVAVWLLERHGWAVRPDEFVFASNLVSATANAVRAFTAKGDAVAVLLPLYAPLQEAVAGSGRRLVPLRVFGDDDGGTTPFDRLDLTAMRRAFRSEGVRAVVWCSPHNPIGRVWSAEEQDAVARLCQECGVLIISDEIHADLTLWGLKHLPMALSCSTIGYKDIVTLSSPGKSFNLAGLHGGFVVIQDEGLRRRYNSIVEHACLHFGSTFATVGMMAAYRHGGPWLERLRAYIESNILIVERYVAAYAPEIVVHRPQASFLIWMDCAGLGLESVDGGARSELCMFMEGEARLKLSDGWSFGGTPASQYQRMNVACSRPVLREALRRLGAAVAGLRTKRT